MSLSQGESIYACKKRFLDLWHEIILLDGISLQLEWDSRTYMPYRGGELRGEQRALVESLRHRRLIDVELFVVLQRLGEEISTGSLDARTVANVREATRLVTRARRIPVDLVGEIAKHEEVSHAAWLIARQNKDFSFFSGPLEKMIGLKKNLAEAIGWVEEPYEALFAEYEPGLSLGEVDTVFANLRQELVPLVQRVLANDWQPASGVLCGLYEERKQEALFRFILTNMGFDFSCGRLDISEHPFCCGMSPWDVRCTTRYRGKDFGGAFFSTIHEAGHGLFHQGIDPEHFGTPMGQVYSLGLHESQSRFWEVWVARSKEFWQFLWLRMQNLFPEEIQGKSSRDLFLAVNKVARTPVRTESDPTTYNLHVMLRYEIERSIFKGEVAVGDLPALWNQKMKEYLGIVPEDDLQGILQDVHWSAGYFGYFPTYTLGNIASAVIFEAAQRDLWFEKYIQVGSLLGLRRWLREKVHRHGSLYGLRETLYRLGGSLDPAIFMRVLKKRLSEVYRRDF